MSDEWTMPRFTHRSSLIAQHSALHVSAMSGRQPGTPRILLARLDHLGDVLLTLPAATVLRRALPGVEIGVLAPEGTVEVARRCPDVDATYAVPAPVLTVPFEASGWHDVAAREGVALRGRFDLALLPRPDDPWTGPLVAAADDEAEASDALGSVPGGRDTPVALHPGSGWPLKNWPPGRWGELAAALRQRYGVAPLVTGSAAEEELARAVVAASGGRSVALAGRLSLGGVIALYRRARLLIATHGGPLHP